MLLRKPFPEGVRLVVNGDTVTVQFTVPENYPYFDGHFPGNPLVPAVTQIGWVKILVEAIRGETIEEYRLTRFKFVSPIRPLDRVRICVENAGDRYSCRLHSNEVVCSSGVLILTAR